MKTNLKKWKKLSSKKVFKSRNFTLYDDLVKLPNGKEYHYYVSSKKGRAVTVLPIDEKGCVLISKEFRYPVNEVIYQSVGGGIEKGETPRRAAERELQEETGYQANKFTLLGTIYGNPGRSGTVFYMYLATTLMSGKARPEDVEFIENEFVTPKRVDKMIKTGVIKEPFFIAAWTLYKLKKK